MKLKKDLLEAFKKTIVFELKTTFGKINFGSIFLFFFFASIAFGSSSIQNLFLKIFNKKASSHGFIYYYSLPTLVAILCLKYASKMVNKEENTEKISEKERMLKIAVENKDAELLEKILDYDSDDKEDFDVNINHNQDENLSL